MTRVMYLIHLASRIITANASNFNMFIRRYAVHTPVRVCLGFWGPIQTRMGVPAAGRSRKCESVSGSHLCRGLVAVSTCAMAKPGLVAAAFCAKYGDSRRSTPSME